MNDELKTCCIQFIVHRSYFILSLGRAFEDAAEAVHVVFPARAARGAAFGLSLGAARAVGD
ncbi:MAG TPA: hypothetical protein VF570_09125 [Pyrinomonadaceae bacterium]|jgi:hypothetical protein